MQLFSHKGITPGIRHAFVIYLASHNRPIHEVRFPSLRDVQGDYAQGFQGMTIEPVPLEALLAARERMVQELQQGLDENERQFLLSLAAGNPEWTRLDLVHLDQLPGIRWKMHNLEQLRKANLRKFAEQADTLAARLDSGSESDQARESGAGRESPRTATAAHTAC
ncbi:hypothetical protein AB5T46_19435 [Luteimonas sp. C3_2_a3]